MTNERRDPVVFEATFDPKLKTYHFLNGVILCIVTLIGIVFLPIWLLGFGQWIANRKYKYLKCTLHQRSLNIKRGAWFKTEKTIPLEKLQDLTMREGPVMKVFGICSLAVETAGNAATAMADAYLVGIQDAPDFRNRVLDQRDALERGKEGSRPAPSEVVTDSTRSTEMLKVLKDIHSTLDDIRTELQNKERG